MPPLIKDYVSFQKVSYLPAISSSKVADAVGTFLPTDSLLELLSRILDTMHRKILDAESSSAEPASILLTGGYGVGKSHLLAVIYSLISQQGAPSKGLSSASVMKQLSALHEASPLTLWIDLTEHADVSLPELVLRKIHDEYETKYSKQVFDPELIPGIDTIKAHELITFNVTSERPAVIMIDGMSNRALKRTVQQLNEDIEFLSFMGYSSKTTRLFLIAAAHEDFFSPKSPLGINNSLMAQTLENFRIEWIDRANIREIISRHICRKNPRQQRDVRKLHSFLKSKLPNFQYSEEEFVEAYPLHPLIFELAERIRNKVSAFSLLDFIMTTYPKVASHRAISLVTIDTLFDRIEYQIKHNHESQRLYAVYRNLAEQAVIRLQDRWRPWGKMLLKATFLFTLADRAPSVRELGDSLLLFEDSDTGLSYNVVGMLLGQMEKSVEHGFSTSDDRLDRTYRLGLADLREELNKYLSEVASQIADDDLRLSQALLKGAEGYFPDWPLQTDSLRRNLEELPLLKAAWRGTNRLGKMLYSERVSEPKPSSTFQPDSDVSLTMKLPDSQESSAPPWEGDDLVPDQPGLSDEAGRPMEWLLWLEPLGLASEAEKTLKPPRPSAIHWAPANPSGEELEQLKKSLALQLTERSSSTGFASADLQALRNEFRLDLSNLFRELYINRGKIVTYSMVVSLNQQHLNCQTFSSFLNYLFKPCFDQLYPLHPDFAGESLTESHVATITRKLFSGQDPTNPKVQRLAGQFALPLGLVSRSDDLYDLNLSITPPLFLTQIFQFLETLNTEEVPIHKIYRIISRPPYGLNHTALDLILCALMADGQIELLNTKTGTVVSRENLVNLEPIPDDAAFKCIQTLRDFPVEVLTHWCRLVTGNLDLPDISTSRGRNAATNALEEWLEQWQQLRIPQHLDTIPNSFLTTQMWRNLAWTKQRFERVAEIIETVLENQVTLIQGIARVVDLFGENVNLLEKTSRNLVEMSHFIHWWESYLGARDYVLAAERTKSPEIEREKSLLLKWFESPHELTRLERRNEFDALFQNFKERYIEHYASRHDQSVGPLAKFDLLEELETSTDFRNLQLLMNLPLGDGSYLYHLEEWIISFRDHRCTLPVRELLKESPYCKCQFRLARPLDLGQVSQDLYSFLDLGIVHHKKIIECHRDVLEQKLAAVDPGQAPHTQAIRALLNKESLPELNQEVMDQLTNLIDFRIVEENLSSSLAAISPTGLITRKELEVKIKNWLDSLSEQEDKLYSLKDF